MFVEINSWFRREASVASKVSLSKKKKKKIVHLCVLRIVQVVHLSWIFRLAIAQIEYFLQWRTILPTILDIVCYIFIFYYITFSYRLFNFILNTWNIDSNLRVISNRTFNVDGFSICTFSPIISISTFLKNVYNQAKRRTNLFSRNLTNWKFRSAAMGGYSVTTRGRNKHCALVKIQLHCLMTMQRWKRVDVARC